jgi:hypothetical protein
VIKTIHLCSFSFCGKCSDVQQEINNLKQFNKEGILASEKEGASGKLLLQYKFYESASTHKESTTKISLEGHDDKVHLIDYNDSLNFFKSGSRSRTINTWAISVEDLISWIKKNGKELKT